MKFLRIFSTTSTLALIASPALADVTAQQVWSDWQNVLDMYGIEVSTSGENMSGDTLSVSDVNAIMSFPEGTATIGLGTINFSEQGDGTVVVTMDESLPMTMDIADPNGGSGRVSFTLNQPGGRQVASGDSSETRYDLDYPTLSMTDLRIEGDDIPDDFPIRPWLYLHDEIETADSPEHHPGQFGNVGFRTTEWERIDSDVHHLKFTICMSSRS